MFPTTEAQPIRLEFIGDIVESIRRYDAATQRSLVAIDQLAVVPQREDYGLRRRSGAVRSATFIDYVRHAGASLLIFETDDVDERGRAVETQWRASAADMAPRGRDVPAVRSAGPAVGHAGAVARHRPPDVAAHRRGREGAAADHVSCQPAVAFHGRIADWVEDLRKARDRGDRTMFVAATVGRAERAIELLAEYDIRARGSRRTKARSTPPCS